MKMLDRSLQRQLLLAAANCYPGHVEGADIQNLSTPGARMFNARYLEEHGLLKLSVFPYMSQHDADIFEITITARGVDFLQDDGGLSAILDVLTVKLHEDTLKALIASKIEASDLPETEKSRWLETLKDLPAEATKHLVLKLLDTGLANWPAALLLLQKLLGSQ